MAPGGSGAAIMDGPEHLERIRTACLKDADRRTQKQLQDIFQLLGKVSFFDQFPTAAVWDLTRVAQLYVTKAWEVVFRQGQPGEAVFFCIDGFCDVHKSDDNLPPVPASETGPSKEHQKAATKMAAKRKWSYVRSVFSINKLGQKTFNPEVLSESKEKEVESVEKEFGKCLVRLRSGSTFGEVALLRKVKRTATVVAGPDTVLLYVYKEDFDNITKRLGNVVYMPDRCKELLQVSPSVRNEDQTLWLMDMLKGHRFFSKLEPSVVKELCKQLELRTLTKGDVLFQQGADGKVFYIILSGQISLHSTIKSDQDVLPPMVSSSSNPEMARAEEAFGRCVGYLGVGDSFGEKALMTNSPFSVTAIAREKIDVMVLEKEVFQEHLRVLSTAIAHVDKLRKLLTLKPEMRSAEDLMTLGEMIGSNSFFSTMDPLLLQEICKVAKYRNIAADTPVFLQGDAPDAFYVILSGTLSVHVMPDADTDSLGKPGNQVRSQNPHRTRRGSMFSDPSAIYGPRVAILTSGQSFGELALINTASRAATILAQESSEMLLIMKQDYETVLQAEQARALNEKVDILRAIPALRDWPNSRLSKLSYGIITRSYPRDTAIVSEGESWRDLYIVKSGGCKVVKKFESPAHRGPGHRGGQVLPPLRRINREAAEEQQLREGGAGASGAGGGPGSPGMGGWAPSDLEISIIGPGQFFGEYALVNKAKQVVSVVTTSTTLVYIIRGEDFFKMVLSHQPTLQKLKKYCQNKQEWMMQRAGSMAGTLHQYRETQVRAQAKQKGKSKGSWKAMRRPSGGARAPGSGGGSRRPSLAVASRMLARQDLGTPESDVVSTISEASLFSSALPARRLSGLIADAALSPGYEGEFECGMRLTNEFWKPVPESTSECSNTVIPIPRQALESYQMKFQLKLPKLKKTPKSKGVPPQLSVRERQALLQQFMVEGDQQQQLMQKPPPAAPPIHQEVAKPPTEPPAAPSAPEATAVAAAAAAAADGKLGDE